jgi:hypothetical protein
MINNLTVMSIGLTGIATVLLLVFPIVIYAKDWAQSQRTGKTFLESATNTFLLHLFLCLFVCFFFSAWGMISEVGHSSFSPKIGIKAFLNIGGSGDSLITYWSGVAKDLQNINYSNVAVTAKSERFIAYALVIVVYMGIFFWVFLFFLPLIVAGTPMFMAMRYYQKNKDNYQGIAPYFRYGVIFVGMLGMMALHYAVVDVFIEHTSGTDYNMLDTTIKLWQTVAKVR